jgi:hypothetical protein
MGGRLYREGDLEGEALAAWDSRLVELLDLPLPADPQTLALSPPVLRLSPSTFEVWRAFHDDVERELGPHGELALLPDFAAKAAEQAARIACVLHVFEHGPTGEIGTEAMEAGTRLALWHLLEARRVLTTVGTSGELADAMVLLDFLATRPEPLSPRAILQLGPYRTRDKGRRDRALAKLYEHGLARERQVGRSSVVEVHPLHRGASDEPCQ